MKAPKYQWQPTTAEIAAAAGISPGEVERFDHNTSPFASDWAPVAAAASLPRLNEYPGADYRALREAAADLNELEPDNIAPGAGADELILLSGRAFLETGATAVAATPTYPLYEISTLQAGGVFNPVPAVPPDFSHPTDEVVRAARDADLVWICTPSNPIGNTVTDDDLATIIAATDGLVVVDAAYAEFNDDTWSDQVDTHHNLIVLRTLSKAFGLAGARVGYAMAHPDLIAAIDAIRPPGSISTVSVDLAVAGLGSSTRMAQTVEAISRARDELATQLTALGLRVLPSTTNFLLCEVGSNAHKIAGQLIDVGLVPRKFPADGPLEEYLRFTVRTASAHSRLISALERYLQ
ncbi:MAG: histidinol-phosphate transaminase [Acidimicrobiia bacterium]|nr:histidinol-phosphate transaminase [Acidimicrobiia bacterium]